MTYYTGNLRLGSPDVFIFTKMANVNEGTLDFIGTGLLGILVFPPHRC